MTGVDLTGAAAVEAWLAAMLAALEPHQRTALFRALAKDLRQHNQKRLTRQTSPDGQPWLPRRARAGQVRRTAKMFRGLRQARRLKTTHNPDGLTIGWRGRDALLATAHHFGGAAGDRIVVPQRQLIGIPASDIAVIRHTILTHLGGAAPRS